MKVLISTTSFAQYNKEPLEMLRASGLDVAFNPHRRKLKPEEVVELAKESEGIIAGTESLTWDVLSKLTKLKVISRCGTGMDNVDLEAAKKLKIKVYNTPDAPTLAVAELTIALMLNLLRKIGQMDQGVKIGRWDKMMGNLLTKKKVGIVGFGRIGCKVAEMLKSFGCETAFYDPFVSGSAGSRKMQLDELLSWADIVSLHVSAGKQMLGEKELGLMRKGAWLINTCRGEVVDELALYESVKKGHLSGAAIDVFSSEPYTGSLRDLPNVILTPHIGSYAQEARVQMEIEAASNLLNGLKEEGLI